MNDTQIKTRHGLILQGVTGKALSIVGFKYETDVQYDEYCEKPDFLIPNELSPRTMIEVHQTETRDSLNMKILRAFTAVMECKAHYGQDLVTINLIFGVPNQSFSSSTMSSLGAIYDISYLPCEDKITSVAMAAIEQDSLELAADSDFTTEEAVEKICKQRKNEVTTFGRALKHVICDAQIREDLLPLWHYEQRRQSQLGSSPLAGSATYYKRMMLSAMYFSDNDFEQLIKGVADGKWKGNCVRQLIRVGLGKIVKEIDGDYVEVTPTFEEFLREPNVYKLRKLCSSTLKRKPDMHWYFEDIRDKPRRLRMSEFFLKSLNGGGKKFRSDLIKNTLNNSFNGIEHTRTWYADFVSLYCGLSFNVLNRMIYQDPRYPLKLWSPFNNLALKWSSHERNENYVSTISEILSDFVFNKIGKIRAYNEKIRTSLARDLLDFRVRSSIKLRRLNPIVILAEAISKDLGLVIERGQIDTLLSDLAATSRVGQMLAFFIRSPNSDKKILASIVAVHDNNGDHKSKEWGARRIATLYRIVDGEICPSEYQESLFVLDGEWADKDVARLYRSGWNHVVRLDDLEAKLRELFDLPATKDTIEIPEVELPLAAEEDGDDMDSCEG